MAVVPEQGIVIDGFELGEMIHAGSMATIFRLAGPEGPLPLVMKIPRLGPGERAVNVIGFEVCRTVLGAMAQGRHHPTLIAYGDVETTPYLVLEHIDGERLDDWLHRAPMPAEEVARIGSAIALALHDVHRQEVVHLDLKPTNVLFRANGEAVLIDFGLARHGHYPDLLAEELRVPLGNWVYMAPEQIAGVRCDARSDLYALGGMLYELATGQLPFGRPATVAELRGRLYRDPVPPRALVPAIPEWLQEIVLRCLEVDAGDRYASARELAGRAVRAGLGAAHRARRADPPRGLATLARRRIARQRDSSLRRVAPPSLAPPASRVIAVAIARRKPTSRCGSAMREPRKRRSPRIPIAASRASPSCRRRHRFPVPAKRIPPRAATSGAWSSCAPGRSRSSCRRSA
jgi:serine/threonine protein kinase